MAKFRTRARTVEMLGRQQIAGIATAVSELFKNAHDAYSEKVEVDFFKSDGLFVLRDDGYGMTLEDFENRWLTIGTESKLGEGNGLDPPYIPKNMKPRPIMGEKGIGRLAIALIGRQVVVLTRAKRDDGLHDLVVAFIHWGSFAIPGVNLDDIIIPIKPFPSGQFPNADDITDLITQVKENLTELSANLPKSDIFNNIYKDLSLLNIDPIEIDSFLGGMSLQGSGHGTHFYIAPADEYLEAEIEDEKKTGDRQFSKFLVGFSNQTFTEKNNTDLKTAFRYWASDQDFEDLVEESDFFTKEDLRNADHYFKGNFDEYGQFIGSVRVYDKETSDYVAAWSGASGKKTLCGPFDIEFGYVAGELKNSHLEADEWKILYDKTDKLGGLYIYRNDLRILPYGLSDYDWLKLEERRSKSAYYYFFSYRRVYGAVKIDRNLNNRLVEKAGREGFQENKAYRQFRDILKNFFIQLAADFFRKDANVSTYFEEKKAEFDKIEKARQKREKQATTKRQKFSDALNNFFRQTKEGFPNIEVAKLEEYINRQMRSVSQIKDPDKAAKALLDAEIAANKALGNIRKNYQISKPRGIGLTKQLRRDWEAYSSEYTRLEAEIFEPASKQITGIIGEAAQQAKIYIDQRRRLRKLLDNVTKEKRREINKVVTNTNQTASETRNKILNMTRDAISEMNLTIERVNAEFSREDFSEMEIDKLEIFRERLEEEIISAARKNIDLLSHVRIQLIDVISFERDESGNIITQMDMNEALDQEVLALREQAELDADLAQIGMTIGIINHEFDAAIRSIRKGIRELRGWARLNDELNPLYRKIRNSFDHLDNYLNLFTPLQRRLYRKAVEIKGYQIEKFIRELLESRFERHHIELIASKDFQEKIILGYPSTFYPVFVNLVDNAIFWLQNQSIPKAVFLDADSNAFYVKNTGPEIAARDKESIFQQGFTRKPGGRGLGLFISKNVLRKEGYDLNIKDGDEKYSVIFIISQQEQ